MNTYTYTFTEEEKLAILYALDDARSFNPNIRHNSAEKERYMRLCDKIALYPDAVGKPEEERI